MFALFHRHHRRLVSSLTIAFVGLAARAALPAQSVPLGEYAMENAFPELKFKQPVAIVTAPGDNTRLFVVEKNGRIQVVTGLDTTTPAKSTFLDLLRITNDAVERTSECGVLGLAFPPDHTSSGRFYVYYSLKISGQLHQRVSRFTVKRGKPNLADPGGEQPLITQQDAADNHNGGDLQFGPDGYLYISVGDGGSGNDLLDQGRFIDRGFHAGILRIDVDKRPGNLPPNAHEAIGLGQDGEAHYAVPADNPFVTATEHHGKALQPNKVRTEFWATGLRNPWRMSFDSHSGRLFAGDVGQGAYEEVDIITRGGDYGWSYREGLHPFPHGPGLSHEPQGFKPVQPIFEYPREVGLSITGGVVYHGNRFPQLQGKYIFADFATGRVIALRDEGQPIWADELLTIEPGITGIGYDPRDGEVLFANMAMGEIKRLKRR